MDAKNASREALALAEQAVAQAERVTDLWQTRESKAAEIIEGLLNDAKANYVSFQRMKLGAAQRFLKSRNAGKKSGAARQEAVRKRNEWLRSEKKRLIGKGVPAHSVAGILAGRTKLTPTQVRVITRQERRRHK